MTENNSYYEAFFQKNAAYYLRMLEKQNNGQMFTFNVYAFIFGLLWFLYRKVYTGALWVLALLFAISLIEVSIQEFISDGATSYIISWCLSIGTWTATGFFANALYLKKARRVVDKVILSEADSEQSIEILKKKGGTSYLFLIIILLACAAFFIYNNQQ
jgi:hypothetical protein